MKKRTFKAKRLLIAIAYLLVLALICALIAYFTGYEIYRDISYGDTEANVMDIYLPKDAYERESNGCVLFIHGGSWSGGDKSEEEARCRLLAAHGYVAVTMNYTLCGESEDYDVFTVLDEIDAALSRIQSFAIEQGISIDKVATSGYSAGAHLSMLYSYSRANESVMDLRFTANMAGPADISPEIWDTYRTARIASILSGSEITEEMVLSGEVDELLAKISPVTYVNEETIPSIIIHGGRDTTVPPGNAESLLNKFNEFSVTHKYLYLEDSDHMLIHNPIGHLGYYGDLIEYCHIYFGD